MWGSCAHLFWRKFLSGHKNALHGCIVDCPTHSRFTSAFKWVSMEVSNCKNFPEISPRAVICNIHNCDRCLFFSDTFALPLPFGLVDRSFFCESMDGQSFPIWHLPFLKYLQCGRRPYWHSQSMFFSRWTFPCLCGVLSFCESVSLYQASWSSSFAFPFFAVSCSKEHFLPFEHEPFDIQDRQSRYFSPAPFEEYAAAALSLDRSLRKPHVLLLLLEDVIDHGPRSLVDSGLPFQNNVLLIWCHRMLHESRLFFTTHSPGHYMFIQIISKG